MKMPNPIFFRFILVALVIGCLWVQPAIAEDITKVNELGPVSVTTTLSPGEPIIGDEITLEITVTYPPNVEVLLPEFGEALNRYTILDFVPRRNIADDGSTTESQKYTLQPPLSGKQAITPILIEFIDNRKDRKPTPDDADAYEILTDRIDFEVQSVVPQTAGNELKPPLGELEPPRELSRGNLIAIVAASLLLLGLLIFAIQAMRKQRQIVVRRSAYEIARRKLDSLLSSGAPDSEPEIESFFVSISSIVRKYLEDRFEMQAPDLTTEEFLSLASKSSDLSNAHQKLLREFLKQADLVKFAGLRVTESEIERSRNAAIQFLEETRENAPLIVDAEATKDVSTDPSNSSAVPGPSQQEKANV